MNSASIASRIAGLVTMTRLLGRRSSLVMPVTTGRTDVRMRMRHLCVTGLLLLAACGSSGHDLKVTMTIHGEVGSTIRVSGNTCEGAGGYADINALAQVVVKDGTGKVVTVGTLDDSAIGGPASDGIECILSGTLSVPDMDIYSIEVSHRGALLYDREDLAARSWTVGFTLGQ